LKIPQQYRCDICIDGKIHKFGHKACADGVRMEFLPGVCIHTDHSGPYARSISGARYSQLYLDRGSGYLWAVRQKKKTEHYESTPKIFTDSWGLSGRKVQILQSDGDGVFTSCETREMLEKEKVRHEWSAPYDSDTNPFIERARRTVFEGVCTALIRSGAPARFWGEAEAHKIYTVNILQTLPDPEKEGSFCSRKNLLEGSRRPPDLEKLMAFGTACTCYIPTAKRRGGKEPAQRRAFRGVILGYGETMPAYRVWDLEARCIKLVSYNFTICHEGYYPFKEKGNWPLEYASDPECFSPTLSGVLTVQEWNKFQFDEEDATEVLMKVPDLLVTRPEPEAKFHSVSIEIETKQVTIGEKSVVSVQAMQPPSVSATLRPVEATSPVLPISASSRRTHEFWQSMLDSAKEDKSGPTTPVTSLSVIKCPPVPNLRPILQSGVLDNADGGLSATPSPIIRNADNADNADNQIIRNADNADNADRNIIRTGNNVIRMDNSLNFTSVPVSANIPVDPFKKPIGILPPKTLREARISPWWPEYKKACQVEYDGHIKNGTWVLVQKSSIPKGKNIMRGKWVFDDKRDEKGNIAKFKARFVAMGFTQKKGIDFQETFAGVVVGKSFRTMLVMLNEDPEHELEHWDIKMAFTQASLEEEIFMYQPEQFEKDPDNFVCLLKKSLYGLKQAAKNWGDLLRDLFRESRFSSFFSDPCVHFLKVGDAWCLCSTHVDDIFILFNKKGKNIRDALFKKLSARVEVENLGPISWALKTAVMRDRKKGIIKISQESFLDDLLKKNQIMPSQKPQQVPSHETLFLPPDNHDPDMEKIDEKQKKKYQSQIGALWWLTSISRPDIYYAVHRCSKMQNRPNKVLEKCLDKIFQYLAATKDLGIIFQRKVGVPVLSGYVDASFGSEDEFLSRIGYFYLFLGNLVSWVSENPSRVMTSSTEAECRGLVHFAKENLWHRQFHSELKLYSVDQPTVVYEDNSSAITLASNLGIPHKRSKHFGIEFAYFKQSVEKKEITPVFVPTDEQPADMLTKTLHPAKFVYFRDLMMGDADLQAHFVKQ
jgi:hypothetical protein